MKLKCFAVLSLAVALMIISASSTSITKEDPELKTCVHQCRQQKQYDEGQIRQCERECEKYSREKQRREREEEEGKKEGRRGGQREVSEEVDNPPRRPMRQSEQEEESECSRRHTTKGIRGRGSRGGEREEGEGKPYVFQEEDLLTKYSTEHGRERVLPMFGKVSSHLKGIENFRVDIFEAQPMTFSLPKHWDADAFFFVAHGKGTITLVHPDNKESFNIERGHFMHIPAGFTVYLVNRDERQKLVLVKLIQPVQNPGEFKSFFGSGGRNPESFLSVFSDEILEAAFKAPLDQLEKLFGQQDDGAVVKASREQVQSLSRHGGSGRREEGTPSWPFGGRGRGRGSKSSRGPVNLFHQSPLFSTHFGTLIRVDSDEYEQLKNFDIAVVFANITRGAMTVPHYNTRATRIAIVTKGSGRFEMACPHVGGKEHRQERELERHGRQGRRGEEEEEGESDLPIHYRKIESDLDVGSVFIVPPGHPYVAVADDDMEVICFEVKANDSEKIPLAGQRSVYKQLEKEAKVLTFNERAEVVDDLLERQDEEFFLPGPEHEQGRPRRRGGRGGGGRRPGRRQEGRGSEGAGYADE